MNEYFIMHLDKNNGSESEFSHGFTHREDAETYLRFLQNQNQEYKNIDYFIQEKQVEC